MEKYPYLAEAISEVVEMIRKKRHLSKSALAELAGVDRNYLLGVIQGKKGPTVNAIFFFCEALHVHPANFMQLVADAVGRKREEKGNTAEDLLSPFPLKRYSP